MKVYIVFGTTGGFCREDSEVAVVYGAFTDDMIAEKVRLVNNAKVEVVELDKIQAGYLATMKALGMEMPQ